MKTKRRILLHICILLLASICIGSFTFFFYNFEKTNNKESYRDYYTSHYYEDVAYRLYLAYYQHMLINEFGDPDKIIATNDANIVTMTVSELVNIYATAQETGSDVFEIYSDDSPYSVRIREMLIKYDRCVSNLGLPARVAQGTELLQYLDNYSDSYFTDSFNMYYSITFTDSNLTPHTIGYNNQYIKFSNYSEKYYDILSVTSDNRISVTNSYIIDTKYANDSLTEYINYDDEIIKFINNHVTEAVFAIDASLPYDDFYSSLINKYRNAPNDEEYNSFMFTIYCLLIASCVALIIAFIIYIVLLKNAGKEYTRPFDKVYLDILLVISVTFYSLSIMGSSYGFDYYYNTAHSNLSLELLFLITLIVLALTAVEFIVVISESIARRLHNKTFLSSCLIGKLLIYLKDKTVRLKRNLSHKLQNAKRPYLIAIISIIFLLGCLFVLFMGYAEIHPIISGFLIVIATVILALILLSYFHEIGIIEEGTVKLSSGALDYNITEQMRYPSNKKLSDNINSISAGLNDAVSKSIKNERMKTELITNVSHDLKTPLTSIINYIDILKREGVNSEHADEYLDILEKKADRLKTLTEDLVEASKLTSGIIELNKEYIDISQLIKQSLGEYNERFAEKQLTIMDSYPETPAIVYADGRKMWRVFENLYSNIYKYALPGTRVYIDVVTGQDRVNILIRNISENPLNFDASELTERFVRGDLSRTTEGNGLGLSIAQSIVERHNGKLTITLDGDLFKIAITI